MKPLTTKHLAGRRRLAVYDPGPADAIDHQPEDAKPGRTLPADMERMLGIDDLAALLSCSRRLVERIAIRREVSQA